MDCVLGVQSKAGSDDCVIGGLPTEDAWPQCHLLADGWCGILRVDVLHRPEPSRQTGVLALPTLQNFLLLFLVQLAEITKRRSLQQAEMRQGVRRPRRTMPKM